MISKTDKNQYYFEVELSGTTGGKGILTAKDVQGGIEIAMAPEFTGGLPDIWTPEHLFLGSLCSGFMTTYQALARKRALEVSGISCSAIGQVNLYEAHLEFTTINLYPKIWIRAEEDTELANELLLDTYSQCIIANSINPLLVNHGEVLVDGVMA